MGRTVCFEIDPFLANPFLGEPGSPLPSSRRFWASLPDRSRFCPFGPFFLDICAPNRTSDHAVSATARQRSYALFRLGQVTGVEWRAEQSRWACTAFVVFSPSSSGTGGIPRSRANIIRHGLTGKRSTSESFSFAKLAKSHVMVASFVRQEKSNHLRRTKLGAYKHLNSWKESAQVSLKSRASVDR